MVSILPTSDERRLLLIDIVRLFLKESNKKSPRRLDVFRANREGIRVLNVQ